MGYRDELEEDTVSSLPIRDAICISAQTPIAEAVAKMCEKSLGCAVIVDQDGTPQKLFTEQSLLDLLAEKKTLDDQVAGDFADPALMVVRTTDPISTVWNAIEQDGMRFIFVTDDDGKLIGVTGQRGLAEYLAESFPQQVLAQRLGGTPWMQQREGA